MIIKPFNKQIFDDAVKQWTAIGLDTQPGNRRMAEQCTRDAYTVSKLTPPEQFLWLESPLHASIGAHTLAQVWDQVGAQVGDQVGNQVRDQVGAQVVAQVRAQVRDK